MNKMRYVDPEIEIIVFENEDIITTSGGENNGYIGDDGEIVLPDDGF